MRPPLQQLRLWLRRWTKEEELREELQFHLDEEAEDRRAAGVPADEANRGAHRDLGNVTLVQEDTRALWTWPLLEHLVRDTRHACRGLRRSPGFAAAALLTLGLGIGANAAVFSVVDAALFRPLPYQDADRLVNVYQLVQVIGGPITPAPISGARVDVGGVRAISAVFEGVEVFGRPQPIALADAVDQSPPLIGAMSPRLPGFLGVPTQLGRVFNDDDVSSGGAIILSDGFWQRVFNRDPAVLGKTMAFADKVRVVVGVMPPTFRYLLGAEADAWLPIADRDGNNVVARLRPGLTVEQAQREIDAVPRNLSSRGTPIGLQVQPVDWNRVRAAARVMLLSVLGAVVCVLIIACANLANLLLARALARGPEIAVAVRLGATRGQLVRQFMVEGVVLAALGGVVACMVAWLGIHVVSVVMPPTVSQSVLAAGLPHLDLRVLAFGCLAAVVAGLGCGIVPALRASKSMVSGGGLSGGLRVTGSSRREWRVRRTFQSVQVTLTLVLLAGAGLLINSVLRMVDTPDGFDAAHLVSVRLDFPHVAIADQLRVTDQLVERLALLPEVQGVALGYPPVGGSYGPRPLAPADDLARAVPLAVERFFVGSNYFRVSGVVVKGGRIFGPEDQATSPPVVIISDNLATRFWPGQSAIGRQLVDGDPKRPSTVVGIVSRLKTTQLADDNVQVFVPNAQNPRTGSIVVRTTDDIGMLAASVRSAIQAIDPRVMVGRVSTVDRLFAENDPVGPPRFYAVLLGVLAALGLLAAAVGLFALLSDAVGQRRSEIAVRMALGADRASIRRLVFRDALMPVVLGMATGLLGAMWLSRFLASQLFQVSPHDPMTFAAVVVLLSIVCVLAGAIPLANAVRVDPVQALRAF